MGFVLVGHSRGTSEKLTTGTIFEDYFKLAQSLYSINSSKMIVKFPAVLNFNRLFLKTQPVHL